jgi:hypothetical protein
MAILAVFPVLLLYICSAHVLLSWSNFQSPGTPLSLHSLLAQLSGGRPLFTAACWHTQHHTTASPASSHCSQQHIRFKPSPTNALPEFSPIGATATSGDVTLSGQLTDTPVTSFRITVIYTVEATRCISNREKMLSYIQSIFSISRLFLRLWCI